jgi:hypothetical protein
LHCFHRTAALAELVDSIARSILELADCQHEDAPKRGHVQRTALLDAVAARGLAGLVREREV